MYEPSVGTRKSGRCREVAISGGSTTKKIAHSLTFWFLLSFLERFENKLKLGRYLCISTKKRRG